MRCSLPPGVTIGGEFGHGVGVSTPPKTRPARIVIRDIQPSLGAGRHATKLPLGDEVQVGATILRDGHETLRAAVRWKTAEGDWRETPMLADPGTDRWSAAITPDAGPDITVLTASRATAREVTIPPLPFITRRSRA